MQASYLSFFPGRALFSKLDPQDIPVKKKSDGFQTSEISFLYGWVKNARSDRHHVSIEPDLTGIINPHFSPAFYCGGGSGHVYCVALRRASRQTVKSACEALGRAPCIHARLHRLATKPGEKCGLTTFTVVAKISSLIYEYFWKHCPIFLLDRSGQVSKTIFPVSRVS